MVTPLAPFRNKDGQPRKRDVLVWLNEHVAHLNPSSLHGSFNCPCPFWQDNYCAIHLRGFFWSSLWPLHRHNLDITYRSLAVHFSSDRAPFSSPFFLAKQLTIILTTTFRLTFDHYLQLHDKTTAPPERLLQCLPLMVCTRVVQARTKPTFGKEMSRAMRRPMEELSTK
jgi:hypothetical protein